jgi:HEXXH motif-containing protein
VRSLPPTFLTLPTESDRTFATVLRKVRLLALRKLLVAYPELMSEAQRAPEAMLERVARIDVLVPLLVGLPEQAAKALAATAPQGLPLHPAVPTLQLSLIDTNPLAMNEAHPEKSGNAIDLAGRRPEEWQRALTGALELVHAGLPEWFAELPLTLQRIVPVGFDAERHLSASYREAPGLAYLSLHPDPLTMGEAIVHETQHGKLNALTWLDPVLENGLSEWSPSPVRPDLRPLMGVLLAAHAFVAVSALHVRLTELNHPAMLGKEARRAEVLKSNAEALETVKAKGKPTALGRRLIDELDALQAACASG